MGALTVAVVDQISGTLGEVELGKRVKLVGLRLESRCPECSTDYVREDPVLEYPSTGTTSTVPFYCEPCDEDWTARVVVRLVVEMAP